MGIEQALETWSIHNRINLYLLDAIPAEALGSVSASKGRTVGEQVAHIHNVRLMWLKEAAPDLLAGLAKVEKEQAGGKALLRSSLEESGEAMRTTLERGWSPAGSKGSSLMRWRPWDTSSRTSPTTGGRSC